MEEFFEVATFLELSNEKLTSHLISVLVITYFCHKFSFHQEKRWYAKFLKLFDLESYNQVKDQLEILHGEDKKYYFRIFNIHFQNSC
jgi:hypothetical protein